MECAKINRVDCQVGDKVDPFASLIGITGIARFVEETLIANGNKVIGIDGLNEGRYF